MARIVHMPDQHNCQAELSQLDRQPIGAIAECSCHRRFVMRDDQRDGPYWSGPLGPNR